VTENETLANLDWVVTAQISHNSDSDNISIHSEISGATSVRGLMKVTLQMIRHITETYEKSRKDMIVKIEGKK